MEDFEAELKADFLVESEDLLSKAEDAFLRLEDERENQELINEIFRLSHNLKGTAKAVGFEQLSELTHVAENLILKIKDNEVEIDDKVVSTLLLFKDKVNEMVQGLKADYDAQFEIKETQDKLSECLEQNGQSAEEESTVTEEVTKESVEAVEQETSLEAESISEVTENHVPEKNENIVDASSGELVPDASDFTEEEFQAAIATLNPTPKEEKIEVQQNSVVEAAKQKEPEDNEPAPVNISKETQSSAVSKNENKPKPNKEQMAVGEDESIRVKLSKINKLNDIVGELVILNTILSQRRYGAIKDELANKSITQMSKLFKETQEISMSLRMLPLKSTFQKMSRIVRDLSKETSKKVNLVLKGVETEVDKTVLESLSDPLVHIIRNAVDHGLETIENRKLASKNEEGKIEISAYHEGSNLVICIKDDGNGIDPEKVKEKAIKKGLITQSSTLTNPELVNMIFHPGFSTKEQVTDISGRGVGMDVVKTNIEKLGGEVRVDSVVGKGSEFKIILPLTLAIIDGMVIRSNKENFVIPLSQVFELIKVEAKEIQGFTNTAKLFCLRGEVLPLFYINSKLNEKIVEKDSEIVIVVRGLSHVFGVVVDDVSNQQQVVIKKLGDDIMNRKGLVGSAIMGDGQPAFIVDLLELFKEDLKENKSHQKFKDNNLLAA